MPFVIKEVKRLPYKPRRLKYKTEVPHGFKGKVQKYCKENWGRPFLEQTSFGTAVFVNYNAKWNYETKNKTGILWHEEDVIEQLVTYFVLQKSCK